MDVMQELMTEGTLKGDGSSDLGLVLRMRGFCAGRDLQVVEVC